MAKDKKSEGGSVCLGAVLGAFGVKGELRVKSFCDPPENITAYGDLRNAHGRALRLHSPRAIKGGVAVRIDGVATREQAEAMRGTQLFAPRDALPDPERDDFYHSDLIGLVAHASDGRLLGEVLAVHNYGAGDIIEMNLVGAASSILLPFTRAVVLEVDIAGGRIVVSLPNEL